MDERIALLEERWSQTAAGLAALQDLVVALVRELPNRDSVLAHFERERERLHATMLQSRLVDDAWLELVEMSGKSLAEISRRKPGASFI